MLESRRLIILLGWTEGSLQRLLVARFVSGHLLRKTLLIVSSWSLRPRLVEIHVIARIEGSGGGVLYGVHALAKEIRGLTSIGF